MTLPREFYDRPTLDVARNLLGKVLVHRRNGVTTSGAIVEVEAYIGESDPACHAAPGRTRRNAPLYGLPGFSYVYLNYGIHISSTSSRSRRMLLLRCSSVRSSRSGRRHDETPPIACDERSTADVGGRAAGRCALPGSR